MLFICTDCVFLYLTILKNASVFRTQIYLIQLIWHYISGIYAFWLNWTIVKYQP